MSAIQILLFATLKDAVGAKSHTLNLTSDTTTIAHVREQLAERFPVLRAHLGSAIAAINEEFAENGDPVRAGDTVAFFPPVSGGSDSEFPEIVRLADAPFSTDELVAAITIPATGAVCVFSGMVRGETKAEQGTAITEHLEYEAYETMALSKMRQVIAEIRQQFPLVQGVAVVQRVGRLEVGQNTIVIACASGHRDQGCFEAARYGIDRLKAIVPVWKKEVRPDGSAWVEGHYTPTATDRAEEQR